MEGSTRPPQPRQNNHLPSQAQTRQTINGTQHHGFANGIGSAHRMPYRPRDNARGPRGRLGYGNPRNMDTHADHYPQDPIGGFNAAKSAFERGENHTGQYLRKPYDRTLLNLRQTSLYYQFPLQILSRSRFIKIKIHLAFANRVQLGSIFRRFIFPASAEASPRAFGDQPRDRCIYPATSTWKQSSES